jgi:hypothetical protein
VKPVKFNGCNCTYGEDCEDYLPLPAYKSKDSCGTVTACWELSVWERLKLVFTGKIYVSLLSFGQPLTPQLLETRNPVRTENAPEEV